MISYISLIIFRPIRFLYCGGVGGGWGVRGSEEARGLVQWARPSSKGSNIVHGASETGGHSDVAGRSGTAVFFGADEGWSRHDPVALARRVAVEKNECLSAKPLRQESQGSPPPLCPPGHSSLPPPSRSPSPAVRQTHSPPRPLRPVEGHLSCRQEIMHRGRFPMIGSTTLGGGHRRRFRPSASQARPALCPPCLRAARAPSTWRRRPVIGGTCGAVAAARLVPRTR